MTDREDPASRHTAAIVLAVGVTCALHIGKLPVAIPVLRETLQLTLVQAGFLLSLVQLAGMTLGLVVGLTADRLGPRRVMLVGLVLGALAGESITSALLGGLIGLGFGQALRLHQLTAENTALRKELKGFAERFERGLGELRAARQSSELTSMGVRVVIWENTRELVAEVMVWTDG